MEGDRIGQDTRAMKETSIVANPLKTQEQFYSSSSYHPSPSVGTPDACLSDQGSRATIAADAVTSPLVPKSVEVQERENFLFFIKILFKILDDAHEPLTRQRAKRIVLECRRKNQLGDPHFHPLMDAVERRLRRFVGEPTWRRAHLFLHHYITTKRRKTVGVMSTHNPTLIPLTIITADRPRA
jgi:hypothetical protein